MCENGYGPLKGVYPFSCLCRMFFRKEIGIDVDIVEDP